MLLNLRSISFSRIRIPFELCYLLFGSVYWMLILFLVFNVLNTGVSEFGILFICFAYEVKQM